MRIPLPSDFQPTSAMLTLIAGVDEFNGQWEGIIELNILLEHVRRPL